MQFELPAPVDISDPIQVLMSPFVHELDTRDWETIEAVAESMEKLQDPHRSILRLVFYDRVTYSQLAMLLGTKAKSYAWRQAQKAISEFEKILLEHPKIKEKYMTFDNWNDNAKKELAYFYSKEKNHETDINENAISIDLLKPQRMLADYIDDLQYGEGVTNISVLSAFDVCGYLSAIYLTSVGVDKDEMLALLLSKQHDYGHRNITLTGFVGLSVRMCDKIARLNHLLEYRNGTGNNESVLDTWKDILGYSVISQMMANNTFTTPLKEDM